MGTAYRPYTISSDEQVNFIPKTILKFKEEFLRGLSLDLHKLTGKSDMTSINFLE